MTKRFIKATKDGEVLTGLPASHAGIYQQSGYKVDYYTISTNRTYLKDRKTTEEKEEINETRQRFNDASFRQSIRKPRKVKLLK